MGAFTGPGFNSRRLHNVAQSLSTTMCVQAFSFHQSLIGQAIQRIEPLLSKGF